MAAATGLRVDMPDEAAHSMLVRHADPHDQPVPAGMIETRDQDGRRVFLPAHLAPAFADPPPPADPGDVASLALDQLCEGLENAGIPTTNASERVRAARAAREATRTTSAAADRGIVSTTIDFGTATATTQDDAGTDVAGAAEFVNDLAAEIERTGIRTTNTSDAAMRVRAETERDKARADLEEARAIIDASEDARNLKNALTLLGEALASDEALTGERDRAYQLAGAAFAALAAVYPPTLIPGDMSDIEGWPVLYLDTPTGQISHHYRAEDEHLIEYIPPAYGIHADAVWDGSSSDDRISRLTELAQADRPQLLCDLLSRGLDVTVSLYPGEPACNDPDSPDPGTDPYYIAEILRRGPGSQVIASGHSATSPLMALASVKLPAPPQTTPDGGPFFTDEPPF